MFRVWAVWALRASTYHKRNRLTLDGKGLNSWFSVGRMPAGACCSKPLSSQFSTQQHKAHADNGCSLAWRLVRTTYFVTFFFTEFIQSFFDLASCLRDALSTPGKRLDTEQTASLCGLAFALTNSSPVEHFHHAHTFVPVTKSIPSLSLKWNWGLCLWSGYSESLVSVSSFQWALPNNLMQFLQDMDRTCLAVWRNFGVQCLSVIAYMFSPLSQERVIWVQVWSLRLLGRECRVSSGVTSKVQQSWTRPYLMLYGTQQIL